MEVGVVGEEGELGGSVVGEVEEWVGGPVVVVEEE